MHENTGTVKSCHPIPALKRRGGIAIRSKVELRKARLAILVLTALLFTGLAPMPFVQATTITSISPTLGPVGTTVTVEGTIDVLGGLFEVFFDATLVASGMAPPASDSVMASFDVPAAGTGVHSVTLRDPVTTLTDSADFLVTPELAGVCADPDGGAVLFVAALEPPERKVKFRLTVFGDGGFVVFCLSVLGSPKGFVKWNGVKVFNLAELQGASSTAAADSLGANDLRLKINLGRMSTVGLTIIEVVV